MLSLILRQKQDVFHLMCPLNGGIIRFPLCSPLQFHNCLDSLSKGVFLGACLSDKRPQDFSCRRETKPVYSFWFISLLSGTRSKPPGYSLRSSLHPVYSRFLFHPLRLVKRSLIFRWSTRGPIDLFPIRIREWPPADCS